MKAKRLNIVGLFLEAAQKFPKKTAIIEGDSSIRFEDLEREVRETSAYFYERGVRSGDRVLVFVPMSIDLYRSVLALFYIGASAIFLDEWVSKERLLLCCQIAKCKAFIGTKKARLLGIFAKEIRKIPIKLSLKGRSITKKDVVLVDPETTALITFTTGSTGVPKAADRSHAFLGAQFKALREKMNPQVSDIDMPVLPIVLFLNLGVGCTSVIAGFNSRKPRSLNPQVIIDQVNKYKVNRITASPFFVRVIGEYLINKRLKLASLTQLFTGGAPVFPEEASVYLRAFPKTDVQVIYGSTEAEPISSISAREVMQDDAMEFGGLPVGKVYAQTELKVIEISEQDIPAVDRIEDLELTQGTIGEIIVAGDHVLKRYFNNSKAFAANKIVSEGKIWHRTGDSGFVKNDQLFLTGRCKQLIKINNQVISPFIVESKLQTFEEVTMGTIVYFRNELIIVVESQSSKNVIEHCLKEFTFDRLIVIDKMPRDPRHFSKIDYGRLKRLIN